MYKCMGELPSALHPPCRCTQTNNACIIPYTIPVDYYCCVFYCDDNVIVNRDGMFLDILFSVHGLVPNRAFCGS